VGGSAAAAAAGGCKSGACDAGAGVSRSGCQIARVLHSYETLISAYLVVCCLKLGIALLRPTSALASHLHCSPGVHGAAIRCR
jgi:hypothetical protein